MGRTLIDADQSGDAPVAPSFKERTSVGAETLRQMASFKDRLAAFAEEPLK